MAPPLEVIDEHSNAEEHFQRAARALGSSVLRGQVFLAICHHKQKFRSLTEILKLCKQPVSRRVRVHQECLKLFNHGLVLKGRKNGEIAFGKKPFYANNKLKIVRLAKNPAKRESIPTKRAKAITIYIRSDSRTGGRNRASATQIHLDDIDSFKKVKQVAAGAMLPKRISEEVFKRAIQKIIRDKSKAKDWGGEASDLFTSQVEFKGRRLTTAFAFKGPGLSGKLTPAKMGKNGDQAKRLFDEPAQLFIIQHCDEIASSVYDDAAMRAERSSRKQNRPLYYCLVNGQDSERIRKAYPGAFKKKAR